MIRRATIFFIFFMGLFLPTAISGQKHTLTLADAIEIAQGQSYDALAARLIFMSKYWSNRSYRAEPPAVGQPLGRPYGI